MKKLFFNILFFLIVNGIFTPQLVFAENTVSHTIVSDDYFDDDYHTESEETPTKKDTFYAWNLFWHKTNDYLLLNIAKPVYQGYSKVTTSSIRSGIHNFRENIRMPRRFLNALLQGEFKQAGIEVGRFIINTTSSFGFADVASQHKPLYPYNPDSLCFGYTLASWGVYEGPYFVIPFWGPSTIREAVGFGVDLLSDPFGYMIPWYATLGVDTVLVLNDLETVYKPYEMLKSQAFDPYIAIKNAYLDNLTYTRPSN